MSNFQNPQKFSLSNSFAQARFFYILFYVFTLSTVTVGPVRVVFDTHPANTLIYYALAGVGALLILLDFSHRQILFTTKNCFLLVLFLVANAVSILCNIRYGITDNLKTFFWTAIQLFLLLCIDTTVPPEKHFKQLRIIAEVFVFVWTFWVIWSLGMFLLQYHTEILLEGNSMPTRFGFMQERLFGVFTDPNYAALCSLVAIVFTLLILRMGKSSAAGRVYRIAVIILQICYVVASGSRTVLICIIASCAVGVGFTVFTSCRKKRTVAVSAIIAVLAMAVAVGTVFVLYYLVQTLLHFLPYFFTGALADFSRADVLESTDTSNGRMTIWRDYIKVFQTTPIVGTSPRNALEYAQAHFESLYIVRREYTVHNGYLSLFVCTGLLGAIPMCIWIITAIYTVVEYLFRRESSQDEYYQVVLILSLLLIGLALAGLPLQMLFFGNNLIDLLFWIVLGYVQGFIRMSEPERYEKKPLPYRVTQKILGRK